MTRINLEEPQIQGYPVVKRTALGQTFNGAILKFASRDRLKRADDGSMEPMVKPNGKHKQELVVTCLTLPNTTAPAGLGEEESVPEPGSIVRLILKGKAYGDWIEAKRSLPNNTVAVGDVITQTTSVAQVYDAQGNPSGGEITDQSLVDQARIKGRSIGIYGTLTVNEPTPGSEWTEKAVTAYRSMLNTEDSKEQEQPFGYSKSVQPPLESTSSEPQRPASFDAAMWAEMNSEAKKAVVDLMNEPPF